MACNKTRQTSVTRISSPRQPRGTAYQQEKEKNAVSAQKFRFYLSKIRKVARQRKHLWNSLGEQICNKERQFEACPMGKRNEVRHIAPARCLMPSILFRIVLNNSSVCWFRLGDEGHKGQVALLYIKKCI